jgi:hypothetical protein
MSNTSAPMLLCMYMCISCCIYSGGIGSHRLNMMLAYLMSTIDENIREDTGAVLLAFLKHYSEEQNLNIKTQ